jgi:hypothetical protein
MAVEVKGALEFGLSHRYIAIGVDLGSNGPHHIT